MTPSDERENVERRIGGTYIVIYLWDAVPIRADYLGGAYVELTFGSEEFNPSEVINVWDYETDRPEIACTPKALATVLEDWTETQDVENPGWLSQYLENAR